MMFTAKPEFLTGPHMHAEELNGLVVSGGCGMHNGQDPQFISWMNFCIQLPIPVLCLPISKPETMLST